MPNVKPFSVPSWFTEEALEPATPSAPSVGGPSPRTRIPRHRYDDHPLVIAVRQYNARLGIENERFLLPRSLDEYVGILAAGLEAGDLCAPLRVARTASRFQVVRAALRFAARAVEAKRPLLAAHAVDSRTVYGIDVDDLLNRTNRKGPKPVEPARLTLGQGEWRDFVHLIRSKLDPPLRDVCLVLVQGDLRANDVLRVTRTVAQEIVARGQAIAVQKGNRRRAWIAEPEARQALSRLLHDPSWRTLCDLVVQPVELRGVVDDTRLVRVAYGRIYRMLASLSGTTGFHGTHAFRRALGAKLVQGKAPDRVIQRTLGHASISTTQIYTGGASPDEVEEYRSRIRQDVFDRK